MVLVKYWPFLHLFISGNIGQENLFYDILEQRKFFLGYKNKKLKVSPWIWLKIGNFSLL